MLQIQIFIPCRLGVLRNHETHDCKFRSSSSRWADQHPWTNGRQRMEALPSWLRPALPGRVCLECDLWILFFGKKSWVATQHVKKSPKPQVQTYPYQGHEWTMVLGRTTGIFRTCKSPDTAADPSQSVWFCPGHGVRHQTDFGRFQVQDQISRCIFLLQIFKISIILSKKNPERPPEELQKKYRTTISTISKICRSKETNKICPRCFSVHHSCHQFFQGRVRFPSLLKAACGGCQLSFNQLSLQMISTALISYVEKILFNGVKTIWSSWNEQKRKNSSESGVMHFRSKAAQKTNFFCLALTAICGGFNNHKYGPPN